MASAYTRLVGSVLPDEVGMLERATASSCSALFNTLASDCTSPAFSLLSVVESTAGASADIFNKGVTGTALAVGGIC